MKNATIQILGIAVVMVGTIFWYRDSLGGMLVGVVYLLAALFLGLSCLVMILRDTERFEISSPSAWLFQTRIRIAVISGWQLLMLGLFDVWSSRDSLELSTFILSNLSIIFCVYNWDRLILIADSPNQDGGAKPLSFLGNPRSRRLFFLLLLVYPLSAFVLGGMMLFIRGEPYPFAFHPAQLCLTLDLIFSIGATVLIYQRYSGISEKGVHNLLFALGVLAVCAAAVVLQSAMSFSGYISALSCVVALSVAICFHSLWKATNRRVAQPTNPF